MDRRRFLAASLATLTGAALGGWRAGVSRALAGTPLSLPGLPYPLTGLEPYLTEETVDFHFSRHHAAYLAKANQALSGSPLEGAPLEEIIRRSAGQENLADIYHNTAQVFNHTFYWNSMKPKGGGPPQGGLAQRIDRDFGDYPSFRQAFVDTAESLFGSGWVWLVEEGKKLKLIKTSNADTPLTLGLKPLLTLDLWEHAYYLDYQERRADYIRAFIDHMVNWDFAAANLKA